MGHKIVRFPYEITFTSASSLQTWNIGNDESNWLCGIDFSSEITNTQRLVAIQCGESVITDRTVSKAFVATNRVMELVFSLQLRGSNFFTGEVIAGDTVPAIGSTSTMNTTRNSNSIGLVKVSNVLPLQLDVAGVQFIAVRGVMAHLGAAAIGNNFAIRGTMIFTFADGL